ncbi:DUF3800 domain-containing protein [Herbaspirillum rubrisubalbicans]|uniref:DUF3800 domain-containing protein n=1 Tax=Herbaspirillum rubrisubalbicans TaxID=80842 RepID=UPI0003078F02|nr:DUF3800 domain-containing protein [Herbaspirillum rubrisubalbicans]
MKRDVDAKEFGNNHPDLYGTEKELIFYYDETNNIRKLLLTENGLNVTKHDNFVLGGIFLQPGQSMGSIEELRHTLRIQKTAEEIKFDLIAKGDLETVLESKKLGLVLSWLLDRNIGIHYSNLNILNWGIIDIVESIVADDAFYSYMPFHREMKNELYRIVVSDLPNFLTLLKKYSYPNIRRDQTSIFLREVSQFIEKNWPQSTYQATDLLRRLLIEAQSASLKELAFLVDEKPDKLIDGFATFFINRICTFKNSTHVFDEEKEIEKAIKPYNFLNEGKLIPVSFVDSKNVGEIQISDVVVGFLGKYFSFIEKTPLPVLLRKKKNFTDTQKKNLSLLSDLIMLSDGISNGLLFRTTTMDSDWKSDAFLHDRTPPPHLLS